MSPKIFEIEIDGATYWVTASNPDDAIGHLNGHLAEIREQVRLNPKWKEVTLEEAAKISYRDDRTGDDVPLSSVVPQTMEPTILILACSEW